MDPSEFFELLPDIKPELLKLPVNADDDDRAVALVDGIVRAALVDFAEITGGAPVQPDAADVRGTEAFVSLLSAATLRMQARATAADAAALHNPDVGPQSSPVTLDLVRVIGRASRADLQRARRLLRGGRWLGDLVGARG